MAVTASISISQNSQNIANNTSSVTVTGKATMSGPSYDGYTRTGTVTIDGKDYSFSSTFPKSSTKTLFTKTVTITHNSDGKKTVSASFKIKTGMTGTLDGGVLSKSTSKTLTTIPRTSSVTCADGNIGSSTTININRASSSFTHTIKYSFLGLTGTIATKTTKTSVGWTIPTSFYTKVPNAKSGKGTITCDTYSGNTKIGTKTCSFNAFVINSNPTVSATVVDTNSKTTALTGDSNKMVRFFSNAKVTITATSKNSATIKSRKVICGNKSGTSTTNTLNNIESGRFVVSCTDSRGLTASTTINKTIINYIKLAFVDMTVARPSTTSNTINYSFEGNYFNQNFGQVQNTIELKYRYREIGEVWGEYTVITPTITSNTFSYEGSFGNTFDFKKEYEFEFTIADKLMTVVKKMIVTRGIPIIDIGKNDVTVNEQTYLGENLLLGFVQATNTREGYLIDILGNKYYPRQYDTGWKTATLTSDFKPYDGNTGRIPKYRRQGNVVSIEGVISPTKTINGSIDTIKIFTLPAEFRPSVDCHQICQGSRQDLWLLLVSTAGNVSFSRYRAGANLEEITSSTWLPFTITYMV